MPFSSKEKIIFCANFYNFQSLFDDRFKNFPPLLQIATNMTYLFQNTNELLDHSRPSPPKLKYIGGINLAKRDNAEEMNNRTKNEDEEVVLWLIRRNTYIVKEQPRNEYSQSRFLKTQSLLRCHPILNSAPLQILIDYFKQFSNKAHHYTYTTVSIQYY